MLNNNIKIQDSINYQKLENSGCSSAPLLLNVNEKIQFSKDFSIETWQKRTIDYLNRLDEKLEQAIPTNSLQDRIDRIGSYIEEKFTPLAKFSNWLDESDLGTWSHQLAVFLAKLPFKAVRNIVRMIYTIIREALFAAVHPLKAMNHLAKLLVNLVAALTHPETWSKIGVGVMGASIGQSLVTGNPLSVIGLGIGAAMLVGGVSLGALKAALKEKEGSKIHAAAQHLLSEAKQLPESLLTGFCMGLIMGGIQRAIYEQQMRTYKITNYEEAKSYPEQSVKEYNPPKLSEAEYRLVSKQKADRWAQTHPRRN